MTDNERQREMARALAVSDQSWASLRDHYVRLTHLAETPLDIWSMNDRRMALKCVCAILGELHIREAQANS